MSTTKIEFVVVFCKDYFGNKTYEICKDLNCDIEVLGLKDKISQRDIEFKGGAYKLKNWCKEHHVTYDEVFRTEMI